MESQVQDFHKLDKRRTVIEFLRNLGYSLSNCKYFILLETAVNAVAWLYADFHEGRVDYMILYYKNITHTKLQITTKQLYTKLIT